MIIVWLILAMILPLQVSVQGLSQYTGSRRLLQQIDRLEFVAQECGWRSEISEEPYIASIQLLNPKGTAQWHLCSGIQVTESLVLTTASCVWALRANNTLNGTLIPNVYVAISPYCRHQKGRQQIQIQNYFMHPDYKQPTQKQPIQINDLAVLKLNVSNLIDLRQDNSVYVELDYDIDWNDIIGQEFSIVSYGQKNQNDSMGTFMDAYYVNMLPHDKDQVQFLSDEDCMQKINQYVSDDSEELLLPQTYLCGEMLTGDLCTGDYGAPVLLKDRSGGSDGVDALLGVFSWKPNQVPCNQENSSHPVLFTNISHYSDWIVDMILQYEPNVNMPLFPPALRPNFSSGTPNP